MSTRTIIDELREGRFSGPLYPNAARTGIARAQREFDAGIISSDEMRHATETVGVTSGLAKWNRQGSAIEWM